MVTKDILVWGECFKIRELRIDGALVTVLPLVVYRRLHNFSGGLKQSELLSGYALPQHFTYVTEYEFTLPDDTLRTLLVNAYKVTK